MLKSYKYKIKPNEDQKVLLNKHFGSIRFAYNYFLNERKFEYETNKQTLNYNDNSSALTKLKKQEELHTFASGSGANIGTMEISTDGVNYTPITYPFTPSVGTYYFKRSTALITGNYTMIQ